MRTKDELFRAAQREIAARRQYAVMQAETARRAAFAANPVLAEADDARMRAGLSLARTAALGGDIDAARAALEHHRPLDGRFLLAERRDIQAPILAGGPTGDKRHTTNLYFSVTVPRSLL